MVFKIPLKNKYLVSVILGVAALGLVLCIRFIFQQAFAEWEEKTLDSRFRLRASVPLYPSITTIGIEDSSLNKIGVWPWDRSVHARMLKLLKSLGISFVNMDIFFHKPSQNPAGDQQLIQAVQDVGNVILSAPFELVDHPCFTPAEYRAFLKKFPPVEAIISSLVSQKNGKTCVDYNRLTNVQWNAIVEQAGMEAGLELVKHEEFVFAEENTPGSQEIRENFERLVNKFRYPFTVSAKEQLWYANRGYLPMQELAEAALGFGHVTATTDSDGVLRRVPLVVRVKEHLIPHMAFAAILNYLQVKPEDVTLVPGQYVLLRNARFPGTTATKAIKIPVDGRLQMRVNFPPTWKAHAFADVLEAEQDPEAAASWQKTLAGQLCTLGYVVSGTGDIGPNPIEAKFPLAFLHAAIMNTILTENFLVEPGWWTTLGITLLLVVFLGVIAPKLGPYRFTLVAFLTVAVYVAAAVTLFLRQGIILKVLDPVLPALILEYTLITIYWYATEDRERRQLRSAFKTYVSKQMLAQILDNPGSLTLAGQRKELTVMFSDVRKFSTLSDKIEPEMIHRLLNMYFSQMTHIAFKYDGFVDKFIGDGLLCFFGDPIAHPDHALMAVRAAIDMQRAVRELAPEIEEKLGIPPIVIRIGINTGQVIVGNMGSAERMEYTVLGSEVNLAQRLESSATPGQIMISARTYEQIKHEFSAEDKGEIMVKGFERPVKVYEVNLPFE